MFATRDEFNVTHVAPSNHYAVHVRWHRGTYDLRIHELFLRARGGDFGSTYEDLMRRKQQVFAWALANDVLNELPPPRPLPPLLPSNVRRLDLTRCADWLALVKKLAARRLAIGTGRLA